jgi:protease secretion system membrane fusion protein
MSLSESQVTEGRRLTRLLPFLGARKSQGDDRSSALDDPGSAIAFGNRIIFYGLGAFLFWATTVPLDEGIPATGTVAVENRRKVVSHLSGGSVETLNIHENQFVRAGETLIILDSTKARVAYNTSIQEYIAASAELARLQAEQQGLDQMQLPDELLLFAEQMGRLDYLTVQEQLFRVRRQALQNEEKILRENITASFAQAKGARDQFDARTKQLSLLNQEISEIRPLVEVGYTAKNNLLAQERQAVELSSVISELQARATKESSTSAELRLRILQRQHEFMKEVETKTAETSRTVANLREKIREARKDLDSTLIKAPVSGQVVELQARAAGAVITPGSKVLEIIPDQEKLLIDVQIPTNLINKVTPGLVTDVQISSFTESPSLVIEGTVQSLSTDKFEPLGAPGSKPYYLARIEITEKGLSALQGRQLRAGMPVSAVIKTGERSLLVYLLQPILKRTFTALQEP